MRATAAVMLVVVVIALIAAITLTDWDLGIETRAEQKEAAVIALDAAIGATFEPLDRATAESLGLSPRASGLVITSLGSNGPAARAGIRTGDVIERIGGTPVRSLRDAAAALNGAFAPDLILMVNRHGRHAIVHLPIRSAPAASNLAKQGG